MGTGVFFNLPAHGHINPTLPIVKELVKNGERIIYYSLLDFKDKIEKTGAVFKEYGFKMKKDEEMHAGGNFIMLARMLMLGTEQVMTYHVDEIKKLNVDYILHDSFCVWGKVMAQHLGIKAINTTSTFVLNSKTTGNSREFNKNIIRMLKREGLRNISKMLRSRKNISKQYGYHAGFRDIYSNTEKMNLVFTTRHFQPGGEILGNDYQFIGPSIINREDEGLGDAFYKQLNRKPLIYIAFGTLMNNRPEFYRSCMDAFSETDYHIVMSVGKNLDRSLLGEIPENITIVNYVNQLELLSHSKLFISHAGMNSVNESLYYKVPLLLFPQQDEQRIVAKRVEELGAGICFDTTKINADVIRQKATEIITNESFYTNDRKFSADCKEAGGYEHGAKLILDYVYSEK